MNVVTVISLLDTIDRGTLQDFKYLQIMREIVYTKKQFKKISEA